jgi:hypothetical protein
VLDAKFSLNQSRRSKATSFSARFIHVYSAGVASQSSDDLLLRAHGTNKDINNLHRRIAPENAFASEDGGGGVHAFQLWITGSIVVSRMALNDPLGRWMLYNILDEFAKLMDVWTQLL